LVYLDRDLFLDLRAIITLFNSQIYVETRIRLLPNCSQNFSPRHVHLFGRNPKVIKTTWRPLVYTMAFLLNRSRLLEMAGSQLPKPLVRTQTNQWIIMGSWH
ncbi:Uncharacterized protein APZ42_000116, partial [Daphnia magna]